MNLKLGEISSGFTCIISFNNSVNNIPANCPFLIITTPPFLIVPLIYSKSCGDKSILFSKIISLYLISVKDAIIWPDSGDFTCCTVAVLF